MLSAFFWSCSYWLTMYSTLLLWRVNGLSGFVRYSQLWHSFYGTVMQSSFLKPLWLSWKRLWHLLVVCFCRNYVIPPSLQLFIFAYPVPWRTARVPNPLRSSVRCLPEIFYVWDKCRTPCYTIKLQKLNGHSLFSCSDSFERYGIGNYWVFLIWIRNP